MKPKNSTFKTSLTPVAATVACDFKGFDDRIELFGAGHQIVSSGAGHEWAIDDMGMAEIRTILNNHLARSFSV